MKVERSSICIERMRFHSRHGVLPQERLAGGDYEVTLRIGYDVSAAVASDRVEDTLNYADVYAVVAREMEQPSNLVEHVAGRIGSRLLETFPDIKKVEIEVLKLNPPMGADCKGAGVKVVMTADPAERVGE